MADDTLERKIHFFAIDVGHDDRGRPRRFDPNRTLTLIESLRFQRDQPPTRYEQDQDQDDGLIFVLPTPRLSRETVRFCRVRYRGLPQLEHAGDISELPIEEAEGIVETTHVVFFQNNIVGVEYNHYGPRPSQLATYLQKKLGELDEAVPRVRIRPLLRHDALEELNQLTDLRWFELRVHRQYASLADRIHSSVRGCVDSIAEALDGPRVVPVYLKFERGDEQRAWRRFIPGLRDVAQDSQLREQMTWFRAHGKRGDTGRVETIDLLGDKLVSHKRIMRVDGRGRALNPASAFGAIKEAHFELQDEIEHASPVAAEFDDGQNLR